LVEELKQTSGVSYVCDDRKVAQQSNFDAACYRIGLGYNVISGGASFARRCPRIPVQSVLALQQQIAQDDIQIQQWSKYISTDNLYSYVRGNQTLL
jgi:hypothetical protein